MNFRSRAWTLVFYPESCPEEWFTIFQMFGKPFCISPLHDKDKNADGEYKKPHYHAIIYSSNAIGFNSVKRLCNMLNAPIPQMVRVSDGLMDYLTHKNHPKKYQYDEKAIQFGNGFEYEDLLKYSDPSETSKSASLSTLIDYIDGLNIFSYADLLQLVRYDPVLTDVCINKVTFLNTYIKSRKTTAPAVIRLCSEIPLDDDCIELVCPDDDF